MTWIYFCSIQNEMLVTYGKHSELFLKDIVSNIYCLFRGSHSQDISLHLWNLTSEKGLFLSCWWQGASCVLLSSGQSWHRPPWLINLVDWNSQNIQKPCSHLPKHDFFNETATVVFRGGASEAVTYAFNYGKYSILYQLQGACCVRER